MLGSASEEGGGSNAKTSCSSISILWSPLSPLGQGSDDEPVVSNITTAGQLLSMQCTPSHIRRFIILFAGYTGVYCLAVATICAALLSTPDQSKSAQMNAAPPEDEDNSGVAQLVSKFNQQTQILLDRAAPLILPRWGAWLLSLIAYIVRVWMLKGFYIVTYGLGIYNLNLLLGFITPQVDPELEHGEPGLPTKSDQEFKPFVRRLPEFKFWWVNGVDCTCRQLAG